MRPTDHFLTPPSASSLRERIGTHLKPYDLARRAFSAFHVEGTARADGRPESPALPAGVRIVDPPVHPFRVVPERVWNAQHDPLPIFQDQQSFGSVAGINRHVLAEPRRVELIDPGVVAGFRAPWIGDAFELRERLGIKRP